MVIADPIIKDVGTKNLRQRSLNSGVITVGTQALKFLLQIGTTMVMARLLTPGDFGLVAMVGSLFGFVAMFNDFGLSTATVQKQSLSLNELSGLFWVNVLLSLLIMIILFVCSPLVAWFYNDPRAKNITIAFGVIAVLSSLGSQHSAIWQRQMKFKLLAVRDLLATLVGIACGLLAAFWGLRYWALVILQASSVAVGTLFLWWRSGWWPRTPKRTAGLKKSLKFGGSLTLANLLAYANHNLDNILIGKFFGDTAVGFYSRAQRLLNKPLQQVLPPVMRVATPLFSRLVDDKSRFRKASIQLTEVACFSGCLLLIPIVPTADWIVLLMLGDQWAQVIPVFKVIAVFGLLEPLSWLLGTILVASGQPEAMAKWRAITFGVVVVSMVSGLPWGVIGVASGYALSGIITRIWLVFFVGKRIGISGWEFIVTCLPFVLLAAGVSFLIQVLRSVWEPQSALLGIISFVLFGTALYILVLICIPKGRKFLLYAIEMGLRTYRSMKSDKFADQSEADIHV